MYLSIRKELCPHDKEFQGETSPPRKNLFFWLTSLFIYCFGLSRVDSASFLLFVFVLERNVCAVGRLQENCRLTRNILPRNPAWRKELPASRWRWLSVRWKWWMVKADVKRTWRHGQPGNRKTARGEALIMKRQKDKSTQDRSAMLTCLALRKQFNP